MRSKRFKLGYTTGTCAQAAAAAAVKMLFTNRLIDAVEVILPSKSRLNLKLIDSKIGKNYARCAVVKDAGDDIDVTDGAKIYAKVSLSKKTGIFITGGEGVGKVTKPGLAVGVGEYAINPVPRQMIIEEITPYLPKDKGIKVVISVPRGRELAKRTFNPRLGIVDGISIIGTTGIVVPKSMDAYKTSLSLQLDLLKASGLKEVVLVLGYVGERFCRSHYESTLSDSSSVIARAAKQPEAIPERLLRSPMENKGSLAMTTERLFGARNDGYIKIGDHIGFMLKECVKKDITKVTLIGHIGKLIKLANGQFDTNIKYGDNRIETIARYAKSRGANQNVIQDLLGQATTEAAVEILKHNGLIKVCNKIVKDIVTKINEFTDNKLIVNCLLLSLDAKLLAKNE